MRGPKEFENKVIMKQKQVKMKSILKDANKAKTLTQILPVSRNHPLKVYFSSNQTEKKAKERQSINLASQDMTKSATFETEKEQKSKCDPEKIEEGNHSKSRKVNHIKYNKNVFKIKFNTERNSREKDGGKRATFSFFPP